MVTHEKSLFYWGDSSKLFYSMKFSMKKKKLTRLDNIFYYILFFTIN